MSDEPCPDGWGFYIARVRVKCEEWRAFPECGGWRVESLPAARLSDGQGRQGECCLGIKI